jgi:hypothetical protein
MKINKILIIGLLVFLCLLAVPLTLANTNTDQSTQELNSKLQKAVENYNSVVSDKSSSWDDVKKSTDDINLIMDQINKLGMDVDFKQKSEVHINNENVTLPANISAEIKPYMLSQSYHFSCNNSTVLAKVRNTNITVAEYMDKVYPGSLEKLPKNTVERLKKTQKIWSTNEKKSDNQISSAIISKNVGIQTNINSNNDGVQPMDDVQYHCNHYVHETISDGANYYAYTQMDLPTPYTRVPEIDVDADLYKDGDLGSFSSTSNYDFNTYYVRATGAANLPSGYHGYYTKSWHYIMWPIGCWPPYSTCDLQTGTVYHQT